MAVSIAYWLNNNQDQIAKMYQFTFAACVLNSIYIILRSSPFECIVPYNWSRNPDTKKPLVLTVLLSATSLALVCSEFVASIKALKMSDLVKGDVMGAPFWIIWLGGWWFLLCSIGIHLNAKFYPKDMGHIFFPSSVVVYGSLTYCWSRNYYNHFI